MFIGYDPRDDLAYKIAERSLLKHCEIDVEIHPLIDTQLRQSGHYYRSYRVDKTGQMFDDRDGKPFSTQFSFTRFCVPLVCDLEGIYDTVLFCDPDVMFRADVGELFKLWDSKYDLMCVQHNQTVSETTKMDGVIQTPNTHGRKNWSSVMLMDPRMCTPMPRRVSEKDKRGGITRYLVNSQTGSYLHSLAWLDDEDIGPLPSEWNYLVGYSDPDSVEPKLVHYTLGTPDMVNMTEFGDEWWAYASQEEIRWAERKSGIVY